MITINYPQLCKLIAAGENETVVFKLETSNAELAREIVALANRRGSTGYIVIGVSSDGREFKSFTNPNLNEERLREFCKTVIFPEPVIQLSQLSLGTEGIGLEHQGKNFIIIQVGPQFVGVYRLNQDFIDFGNQVCFRKNEVWVRRKTVSGLATPEEIKGLFDNHIPGVEITAKNEPALSAKPSDKSAISGLTKRVQNYAKMPYEKAFSAILKEINRLANRAGGKLYAGEDPLNKETALIHHLVLPVNGNPIILRVILIDRCTSRDQVLEYTRRYLTFEHGVMLIVVGEVAPDALKTCPLQVQQSWGWFFTSPFWHLGLKERDLHITLPVKIMEQLGQVDASGFALANIQTDKVLHRAWDELMVALKQDETVKQAVELSYIKIMTALSFYLKEECPRPASKNLIPKKLLENEIYDPDKFGDLLLVKQPQVYEAIVKMLEKTRI